MNNSIMSFHVTSCPKNWNQIYQTSKQFSIKIANLVEIRTNLVFIEIAKGRKSSSSIFFQQTIKLQTRVHYKTEKKSDKTFKNEYSLPLINPRVCLSHLTIGGEPTCPFRRYDFYDKNNKCTPQR